MGRSPDRIERAGDAFLARVGDGYRELAGRFPERIVALDGSLPAEEIAEQVLAELQGAGLPA
jgi:thymidylate kinase